MFIGIRPVAADVQLPEADPAQPLSISADYAARWTQGNVEIWVLRGRCSVSQGATTARGGEAVVWIENNRRSSSLARDVTVYLEGGVQVDYRRGGVNISRGRRDSTAQIRDKTWLGNFRARGGLNMRVPRVQSEPRAKPAILQRAVARRRAKGATGSSAFAGSRKSGQAAHGTRQAAHGTGPANLPIRQVQFTTPIKTTTRGPAAPPRGTRRVRVFPRGGGGIQAEWFPSNRPDERIAIIDNGVQLLIDGVTMDDFGGGTGTIDVSTDRLVIWFTGKDLPDLRGGDGGTLQSENLPLEIYMEGNIEFRQGGDRVIYAQRMYYDVANRTGTILDAEIISPVREYQGHVRVRAKSIRQVDADRFLLRDAVLTTSELGVPRYSITSDSILFEDLQFPRIDPMTGLVELDQDGRAVVDHRRMASSSHNFLRIEGVPIFYWPTMATNLDERSLYINRLRVKSDRIFGQQVLSQWNGYQMFGFRNPLEGTEWDIDLDYLSDRGLGVGTAFRYDRDEMFGLTGRPAGFVDAWFINDNGRDDLGRDRLGLVPEEDVRGRILWRHRQQLWDDYQLTAELGYISDRNFLEQYYENEWDGFKDQRTGVELKYTNDNISWSLSSDVRINDFFTQTEWLPRADHFWLGQSLLFNRLTWYEHTQVGYARLRTADPPANASELAKFALLPGEAREVEGERIVTRQEIDMPFQLGVVKVVPYLLGEAAHWGSDLSGNDNQRLFGQVGLRASLPIWKVNPAVDNPLFDLHGLAHKVTFDFEMSYADANRNLTEFPLYDSIDDDSIEHFRRRFAFDPVFDTFSPSPPIPLQFDRRFYALRSGLAGWVTSPSVEIADDMAIMRFGVHQRWQTKRGPTGAQQTIDWITLDVDGTWFPNEDRDNYGESLGLVDYDFRWHVGDRLTLLSDGIFDFFDGGQSLFTVGGFLNRPENGSIYLGYRSLQGPINSQVLATSIIYRMSEHWIGSFGTAVDLGDEGNIGQNFAVTRIGESFIVRVGVNVDEGKDNVGVSLAIEPVFMKRSRLSRTDLMHLPVGGIGRL